jgi:hypothetical protein
MTDLNYYFKGERCKVLATTETKVTLYSNGICYTVSRFTFDHESVYAGARTHRHFILGKTYWIQGIPCEVSLTDDNKWVQVIRRNEKALVKRNDFFR